MEEGHPLPPSICTSNWHTAQVAEWQRQSGQTVPASEPQARVSAFRDSTRSNQQLLSLCPFPSFLFFSSQTLTRNDAVDVTFSLKGLYDDTKAFLDENLVSGWVWNKGGQCIPSEVAHSLHLVLRHWKTCRSILPRFYLAVPAASSSPRVIIDHVTS